MTHDEKGCNDSGTLLRGRKSDSISLSNNFSQPKPKGAEADMNIDQAFPSKYLKASDMPDDGTALPFVIEEVRTEEIGKDKQIKPVLYFKDQEKGMVANKTNCNTIAKALGSRDTDDWTGKTILLYATEVQFGDEMVESIRVKLRGAKNGATTIRKAQGPDDALAGEEEIEF